MMECISVKNWSFLPSGKRSESLDAASINLKLAVKAPSSSDPLALVTRKAKKSNSFSPSCRCLLIGGTILIVINHVCTASRLRRPGPLHRMTDWYYQINPAMIWESKNLSDSGHVTDHGKLRSQAEVGGRQQDVFSRRPRINQRTELRHPTRALKSYPEVGENHYYRRRVRQEGRRHLPDSPYHPGIINQDEMPVGNVRRCGRPLGRPEQLV